jgi:hypothetical protein
MFANGQRCFLPEDLSLAANQCPALPNNVTSLDESDCGLETVGNTCNVRCNDGYFADDGTAVEEFACSGVSTGVSQWIGELPTCVGMHSKLPNRIVHGPC